MDQGGAASVTAHSGLPAGTRSLCHLLPHCTRVGLCGQHLIGCHCRDEVMKRLWLHSPSHSEGSQLPCPEDTGGPVNSPMERGTEDPSQQLCWTLWSHATLGFIFHTSVGIRPWTSSRTSVLLPPGFMSSAYGCCPQGLLIAAAALDIASDH